jgi:hypothetical protein
MKHVRLEIDKRDRDPHRREALDQREAPSRDEQLDALEEHARQRDPRAGWFRGGGRVPGAPWSAGRGSRDRPRRDRCVVCGQLDSDPAQEHRPVRGTHVVGGPRSSADNPSLPFAGGVSRSALSFRVHQLELLAVGNPSPSARSDGWGDRPPLPLFAPAGSCSLCAHRSESSACSGSRIDEEGLRDSGSAGPRPGLTSRPEPCSLSEPCPRSSCLSSPSHPRCATQGSRLSGGGTGSYPVCAFSRFDGNPGCCFRRSLEPLPNPPFAGAASLRLRLRRAL